MHELSRLFPMTNLKKKHFFLTDYAPIPELTPHLLSCPLSIANVNYFKTPYIFLLQTVCIKEPLNSRMTSILFSPSSPAVDGLDCISQDLVPYLATIWINKSFLSERLSAMDVFCLTIFFTKIGTRRDGQSKQIYYHKQNKAIKGLQSPLYKKELHR